MDQRIENTLLNVRKTARLLDVHPNTLRNWTNQGLLPCYTVNARGDRRFRREDIEEFLARHRRFEAQPRRYLAD
ncbi:MAG: helix-turn-helix domain-containing protein [Chloroflexi bacterium]|nr:helix-turn-helix domain-containing protein [Chloroflexota bacterium]